MLASKLGLLEEMKLLLVNNASVDIKDNVSIYQIYKYVCI